MNFHIFCKVKIIKDTFVGRCTLGIPNVMHVKDIMVFSWVTIMAEVQSILLFFFVGCCGWADQADQ